MLRPVANVNKSYVFVAGLAFALLLPAAGSPRTEGVAVVDYRFPSGGRATIQLQGQEPITVDLSSAGLPDTIVRRGDPVGDTIPIELVSLELRGQANVFGQPESLIIVQGGTQKTSGRPGSTGMETDVHFTRRGAKWRASSYIDVYGNVSIFLQRGGELHAQYGPLRVQAEPYLFGNPPNEPKRRTLGRVDHFKCYGISPKDRFRPRGVTLADQFEDERATVRTPLRFCAPVSKNKRRLFNPAAHLKCYPITSTSSNPKKDEVEVSVENQFGAAQLIVLKPRTLCLPTLKKRLRQPVPRPAPPSGSLAKLTEHFKCYDVKPKSPFAARTVTLEDQFEIERARVLRPVLLCAPVEKNGQRLTDAETHLTCYAIKDVTRKKKGAGRLVVVRNQFGVETLTVLDPQLLCVPSTKTPPCSQYAERARAALTFQGQQIGTINEAIHIPYQGVKGSPCE